MDDPRARMRELTDFAAPWSVWIAATLRIADHVAAGAVTDDVLAERTGADPDALRRLMRYLVARSVFAEADERYANTDVSELLRDEAGWRPWLDLDGAPGLWAESWARLLDAVRTGAPGRDERAYYEELARGSRGESFDALMARQVQANAEAVATVYDWSDIEHVVDVGGGTGALLRTVLAAHPHLRGTVFDLSQVVAAVEPEERLAVVGGDVFFDPIPPADAYVLSQILHGWPDDAAARILARLADARVLVIETVLGERPSADEASFDLFMLTLVGGRQRRLGDFARLAASSGLAVLETHALRTGNTLLVLAPGG